MAPKKGSVNKKKTKIIENKEKETLVCPMCGKERAVSYFYRNTSPLYKGTKGIMVFCKDCILEVYEQYYLITKDYRSAIYITCLKFDIPFGESEFEGTMKQILKNTNAHPLKVYMTKINSLGSYNNELCGFEPTGLLNSDINKKDSKIDVLDSCNIENDLEFTEQDAQAKEDVIKLIGYDPFAGYSKFDQKFLYNELISYLDEDTLDDSFKLSQIIQLVNNNNQIRKIDLVIAKMTSDTQSLTANHGDIKSLSQTKKSIVDNTDKIAKENSISVKNRGDKKAGKSTLTYMMKQYRELGFEDAEQDYYDQNKAYGMKVTADISNKSLLEQLQIDENDYTDMLNQQRQLIQELQESLEDKEEEVRQLNVLVDEYKNK